MATTEQNIKQIVFNKLSTAKYEALKAAGELKENEFYITPDESVTTDEFNEALALKADKSDTYTKQEVDEKIDAKDSLPAQAGNAGKFLSTNGTAASWEALPESSTTVKGIVKLASAEEITAGTATNVAVSVKDLADAKAIEVADKAELVGKITAEETARQEADTKHTNDIKALQDGKADKATTLAGYGIEDAYTKSEVDAKVASVYKYKGSVNSYADLPTADQVEGDVYNVAIADAAHGIKAGDNVAWVAVKGDVEAHWDVLAGTVDLSGYFTKDEVNTALALKADKKATEDALALKADKSDTYTKQEVDDALALKAVKADVDTEIAALKEKDTAIDGEITALKQKDTAIDGEIAALKEKDTALDTAVKANASAIADANAKINANEQAIAANATEIAKKANKATTLAGYGIEDAYTKTETNKAIEDRVVAVIRTWDDA